MPTKAEDCPNYETNKQLCPREDTGSPTYAICCECVRANGSKGQKPLCMTGIKRPARTRSLPIGRFADCKNRERNRTSCACYETSCKRRGVCCDCVRFHWGHHIWPRIACA